MIVNEFCVLLLGVKNEKLGKRLEKNICRKIEDKIYLKQAEDKITRRNG